MTSWSWAEPRLSMTPLVVRLEELGVRVRMVAGAEQAETAIRLLQELPTRGAGTNRGAR